VGAELRVTVDQGPTWGLGRGKIVKRFGKRGGGGKKSGKTTLLGAKGAVIADRRSAVIICA